MRRMDKPVVILHNLRSIQNVGSIIRTAACMGDLKVYCTGHTPYPKQSDDNRLPHIIKRQTASIAKTSLGAETLIDVVHGELVEIIGGLRDKDYEIVACEQGTGSTMLEDWQPKPRTAVIFGNEPHGIDPQTLQLADTQVEIPMHGKKESLNVSSAAAIVLYTLANKVIHSTA